MRLPIQAAPAPRSAPPIAAGVRAQSAADAPCTGDAFERARCEAARVRASHATPYDYSAAYRAYDAPYDTAYNASPGLGGARPY